MGGPGADRLPLHTLPGSWLWWRNAVNSLSLAEVEGCCCGCHNKHCTLCISQKVKVYQYHHCCQFKVSGQTCHGWLLKSQSQCHFKRSQPYWRLWIWLIYIPPPPPRKTCTQMHVCVCKHTMKIKKQPITAIQLWREKKSCVLRLPVPLPGWHVAPCAVPPCVWTAPGCACTLQPSTDCMTNKLLTSLNMAIHKTEQHTITKTRSFKSKHTEVLLYIHKNHRFIRDRSPGQPLRISHSSGALKASIAL